MRLLLSAGIFLLFLSTHLSAAVMEDLEKELKEFRSQFKITSELAREIKKKRRALINTPTGSARAKAYASYLENRAASIEATREVIKQLSATLAVATRMDFKKGGKKPNLKEILDGYHEDTVGILEELNLVNAEFDEISKDAPGEVSSALKSYKDTIDIVSTTLSKALKGMAIAGTKGSSFDKNTLVIPLKTLRVALIARQKLQMVDYKVTAAASRIEKFMGNVKNLYTKAFEGLEPAEYIEGFGKLGGDTRTWIESLNEIIKTTDMPDFKKMHKPAAMKLAVRKMKKYLQETEPYTIDGTKYFYDPENDRWYWIAKGMSHWAPFDWNKSTGLFVRKIENGDWVSMHPDYKKPVRVYPDEELEKTDKEEK